MVPFLNGFLKGSIRDPYRVLEGIQRGVGPTRFRV